MNNLLKSLRRLRNHEVVRESSLIAGAQIIVILLGLANSAVLAHLLGADQFGQYQYLLTWVAIAWAVGLPGMSAPILKSTLKNYDRFYWIATKRSLLISNVAAILLLTIGTIGYWLGGAWKYHSLMVLLVAASMPVSGIQHYESIFVGKRDFKTSRALQVLSSVLMLVGTCLVAWIFQTAEHAFVAYIAVRTIISVYAFVIVSNRLITCPINPNFEDELLRQGWRQTLLSFFILALSRLDRIVLGIMNPTLLAQYHIGTLIPISIKNNSKIFMGVLISRWGKMNANQNKETLNRNAIKIIFFGFLAFAMTAALLSIIIPVIFGEEYQDSIMVGVIFSLSLIPHFWNYMRGLEDQIQGDGRSNQLAQVVRYIVQSLAVIGLAPHGIFWLVLSPLIADLAFTAASFWRPPLKRVEKTNK